LNGHIALIHSVLPATVDLKVSVPENHPSTRNLGAERVGSGTIVDPSGYVLTVHYITLGAKSITVTFSDGEQCAGKIAAQDPESGLALIKVPNQNLPYLRASSEELKLGQAAFIVASAGETARRVSGGYITSLQSFDGQWEYLLEKGIYLSTFNPGFGGGTLADFKGRLIGVASLNLNEVGKFTMAIPIEYYLRNEQELKLHGEVRSRPKRAWLGFYPQLFGGHLVIGGVVPGGPAETSGLKEGDIVLNVDQQPVRARADLYRLMWTKKPGERFSFRILREDENLDLDVVSGDRRAFYRL